MAVKAMYGDNTESEVSILSIQCIERAHSTKGSSPGIKGFKSNACSSAIYVTVQPSGVGAATWSLEEDGESATAYTLALTRNEFGEYLRQMAAKCACGRY